MQDADQGALPTLDGTGLRVGIVRARFNEAITAQMARVCTQELRSLGVQVRDIRQVEVPGALEIPLALQALAESDRYDALVAIGCVIRGETYHFELVCHESAAGITRVGLDQTIPIANAVLTTENEAQALARVQEKARDAARVAVEMANLLEELG